MGARKPIREAQDFFMDVSCVSSKNLSHRVIAYVTIVNNELEKLLIPLDISLKRSSRKCRWECGDIVRLYDWCCSATVFIEHS